MTTKTAEREYSRREELANTLSAAVGLVFLAAFTPILLRAAANTPGMPGAIVFLASVFTLYLASTIYHALPAGRGKMTARIFDHAGIFILIAGTYTPFCLRPLAAHNGTLLLVLEWSLAGLGILFKLAGGMKWRRISNVIYLGMGWLGVFWMRDFIAEVSWSGFGWILAGGASYTIGIVFYAARHRAYAHFIWHLFVFAGTACHAWAVLRYGL